MRGCGGGVRGVMGEGTRAKLYEATAFECTLADAVEAAGEGGGGRVGCDDARGEGLRRGGRGDGTRARLL